ncbi:hypothetical protein AB1N83_003033 [Pleurotus pulmonarius]
MFSTYQNSLEAVMLRKLCNTVGIVESTTSWNEGTRSLESEYSLLGLLRLEFATYQHASLASARITAAVCHACLSMHRG